MGIFTPNGSVSLYYDNSKKIETTGYGVSVYGGINAPTGIITASSFSGSGSGLTNIPAGQLTGTLPAIDGSALLNVNATGSGIVVLDDNVNIGSAKTVNFGTGLDVYLLYIWNCNSYGIWWFFTVKNYCNWCNNINCKIMELVIQILLDLSLML